MQLGKRCNARTRRHTLCQSPAMANGRCRMHGGCSLAGREHGRYRTGFYTKAAIAGRRALRAAIASCKETLAALD